MDKNGHAGNYYEDWQLGDEYVSMGRTLTTTDIETYTNYMGDYNPLYTDEEFAKREMYGTRIAPELLIHAISIGQVSQTRLFEGTMLGFVKVGIDFVNPVKPGDTIFTKGKFVEKKETVRKQQGIVNFYAEIMNQRGEIIMKSNQFIAIQKKNV
ncbi:MAG: MaoC/PaaZ C-terminal domain-containing protein [Thermodesulfobacteriota bacterium]